MHTAEVRVHYAALLVSLVRAGMYEAGAALREWGAEWLFDDDVDDEEQFTEDLDVRTEDA